MSAEPRIVIVGAGHAGGRAAEALRAAGFKGEVLLIGEERHPPYERPPLSKELLAGTIEIEKIYVRPPTWYQENGISLRLGTRVGEIDRGARRLHLESGGSEAYDLLLLTTGARPRILRGPGAEHRHVLYLRDIEHTLALRPRLGSGARVAVIGAGFIGLEAAAVARKSGAAVTVIEFASQPLGRVAAPEIGAFFAELHREHGVELRLSTGVTAIEESAGGLRVVASDGRTVEADFALAGIGAAPNTELAQAAGLPVDDGIIVDEFGRTADPAIFAAGDVTRHFNPILGRRIRLEAWQNAQNQAIAVAKVMAGGTQPFAEVPWFWTDQYDVNLQMAGAPEKWDALARRPGANPRSFTLFYLQGGRVVAANTVNNPRDMRFAKILIERGRVIDPARLADPTQKLQDLAK
ncbi:MAG TPA: FAD-dependent oxidoreductase [Stellaceae bacterium]|nr:FAD-dependent oxidoreductase [Stellaceae bacterium]